MLKFQNNNTTLISTFKDFILTVYVVIDDLYHQFAPPEAISRRHVIVIRKGFLSILLYDSFKDFIIMDRPNFAFTAFIFCLYSIYIYFMGSDSKMCTFPPLFILFIASLVLCGHPTICCSFAILPLRLFDCFFIGSDPITLMDATGRCRKSIKIPSLN